MTAAGFCPRCATARTGDMRYCASCAYDFGVPEDKGYTIVQRPAPAGAGWAFTPPAAPAEQQGRSRAEKLLIVLIVGAVLVGGYLAWTNARVASIMDSVGRSFPTSNMGQVPPAGTILFGTSFDPQTMAVQNVISRIGVNQAFSMTGRLPRAMSGQELALRVSLNGQLVSSQSLSDLPGMGELWGITPGPLYVAGVWLYEVTDIGGNVLASGTITAF